MTQIMNVVNAESLYTLSGQIVHGRGVGKSFGLPTANLQIESENDLPPIGVYAAEILLADQIYYGVTNIGTRPTVDDDKDISVETFILNFSGDIYGEEMTIRLCQKLRCPQKFAGVSGLLEQIQLDCLAARQFFGLA